MRVLPTILTRTVASLLGLGVAVGGLAVVPAHAAPVDGTVDVQLLATNDFHGRLAAAESLAGSVGQLRAEEDNTLYVGVGDLIGASTFESFIAQDKPALDVMNALDLAVSAAGNHEFDAGYTDLLDRVMKPFDAVTNLFGGAQWPYLAANVRKKSDNSYALPGNGSDGATWMTEVGGVKVGFVGAVTEDLPVLVSPAGISDVEITSIVDEVNAAADRLTADGADVVVLLAHEGAQGTGVESVTDSEQAFGKIVEGVNDDVDVIFSAHTHLRYAHVVNGRPVLSGGEYGTHLSQVVLSVDPVTDEVSVKKADVIPVADVAVEAAEAKELAAEVKAVVAEATAEADVLGAEELGRVDSPLRRAVLASGAENRGGESTLGNHVAEVHRWATRGEGQGAAEIAFMNPGGLRADMNGNAESGYPATVTYKQAAAVQPFANTLVNMNLTGAKIKEVLEQQWQRDGEGNVPSRPFLRLGASEGFTYTYDPTRAEGGRITGMWLHGEPVVADRTYSVTANAFLASGGDNFRAFADGTNRNDTGQSDLTAMVDHMAAHAPVAVDHSQRAVGLVHDTAAHTAGDTVEIKVSSWSFSAADSVRDEQVQALVGDTVVGSGVLDHGVPADGFDETGTATVSLVLPADLGTGEHVVTLRGEATGTEVTTTVSVKAKAEPTPDPEPEKVTPTLTATFGKKQVAVGRGKVRMTLRVVGGEGAASGTVEVRHGKRIIGRGSVVNGTARVQVASLPKLGNRVLTVTYSGDHARTATSTTVRLHVVKAAPRVSVTAPKKAKRGKVGVVRVRVTAPHVKVGGRVQVRVSVKGRTVVRSAKVNAKGVARVKVRFPRAGKAQVKATYRGSTLLKKKSRTVRVQVRR